MSSVVPEGWSVKTFGDLTTSIKSGLSRRLSLQDIGIPVINSGNLTSRGLDTRELKYWYLDDPQGANTSNYVLINGDILLNFINSISQIGKSCIFRSFGRPCIYTTNIFRVRVGEKSHSEFVHHLMTDDIFQEEIGLITKPAVNQASFTKDELSNIRVSIPPLPEQKKIASILTSVDEVIENTQKQIDKLQDLKKATMNELLTKGIGHTEFRDSELGRIPRSWEVKSLEHVCEKIWIGLVTTMTKFYVEKGIPLIRNSDIKETGIRMSKLIQLDIDFSKKHSSRAVQKGDVVTVHTGDIGTSAVINHLLNGAQGFATLNSRINKSLIIPQFYSQILNSEDFKLRAKRVVTGDGRDNLNLKDFIGLLISVPQSLSEQENIVTTLLSLEQNIDRLTHKLSQTQSLKKSLMQDLLTGKVRVTVN